MTVKERIAKLRVEMEKNEIEAFIVFSADPHMSEYLPNEWKERTWISGFTGSAGFVVILKDKAGLWTDGRYFTQAPVELKGSGIDLFKDGVAGTPNYIDWIISETSENAKVAVNSLATSINEWEKLHNKLQQNNRVLIDLPLLDNVWKDRGEPSKNPVFVQPIEKAGESVESKLTKIREKMIEHKVDTHIISSLDDVAWTLNLRGSDVKCNPVFLGYIYLSLNEAILFVEQKKLTLEAKEAMNKANVTLKEYDSFFTYLYQVEHKKILIAPNCNQSVLNAVQNKNEVKIAPPPGHLMKAIKNDVEMDGFRSAMVKDGVAMVKFLYWLTHNVGKEPMTEYSIAEKLESFRAEQKDFVGISFDSIVGFKGNGAIIHYKAPKEGSAKVTKNNSILIDSGGQYLEGTTDITRTLPLGEVSEDFKRDYTLVLKGHIQLSMAKFPRGTRGIQLDTLARLALWREGKDYNHGTGHGVGSFMNVHEGPQNIRKDLNPQELIPGMVLSNEPGYYVENKYGIRIENLVAVKTWKTTEWNEFYDFETLTVCPISTVPVIKELMTEEEIQWLNDYHDFCDEKISSHLDGEVKKWFKEMVRKI